MYLGGDTEHELMNALEIDFNHFRKNKTVTNEILAETILEGLETVENFRKLKTILDYANTDRFHPETITQDVWNYRVVSDVNTGGNEGIYIDWYLKPYSEEKKCIPLGTLKTLDAGISAYVNMGAIAGLLVIATEMCIFKNDEMFIKEEKQK